MIAAIRRTTIINVTIGMAKLNTIIRITCMGSGVTVGDGSDANNNYVKKDR